MGASVALASLAVFGFSRLIRANAELAAMREEVATLAAERERMRIARDLHDLLGHSLTTVTVKAALASRLFEQDPVRARREIAEVEVLARESLADVRAAVAGYREVRLATELATAREVLEAAGIDAQLPGVVEGMSPEVGGLFGWVVREGVTNVVRHSKAKSVRITLDATGIEIVDDGSGCARKTGEVRDDTSGQRPRRTCRTSRRPRRSVGRWTRRRQCDRLPVTRRSAGLAVTTDAAAAGANAAVIRVLMADDQHLVRGALAALLNLEPDLEVVAQVGRGDEVVAAALDVRPDVAVLDVEMPGLDGLAAAAALQATTPELPSADRDHLRAGRLFAAGDGVGCAWVRGEGRARRAAGRCGASSRAWRACRRPNVWLRPR